MADLSGLPALDVNPIGFGAQNNAALAQSGLAQLNLQKQQDLQPLEIEQAQETIPLETKEKKQQSRLQDMSVANDTLAQVAKDAQAADPEDAPNVWDQGMKDAAANGVGAASQYVGHYRADLAERVGDVYGGQGSGSNARTAPPGPAGADPQAMARAIASMPPAKISSSLANINHVITTFNDVKDEASWEAGLQSLKDAGIVPPNASGATMAWNPMNYASAARAVKALVPYRDALQERSALMAVGATPPAPAPLGTSTYIGSQPDTQLPVYHNPITGQDTVGKVAVGPKPSAAISTFQYKLKLAQGSGMSSQDALAFANGTKALPPERLQAIALTEANKELGDATLSGAVIPDPDSWVRDKAAENFRLLSSSATKVPGPPATTPAPVPAPSALPARAISAVQAAGGNPIRFNNGLTYKWDAKSKRAVQVQ